MRQLLWYKLRQIYYKLRRLLQIAAEQCFGIKKGSYYAQWCLRTSKLVVLGAEKQAAMVAVQKIFKNVFVKFFPDKFYEKSHFMS